MAISKKKTVIVPVVKKLVKMEAPISIDKKTD